MQQCVGQQLMWFLAQRFQPFSVPCSVNIGKVYEEELSRFNSTESID